MLSRLRLVNDGPHDLRLGAICLSSSSHFICNREFVKVNPPLRTEPFAQAGKYPPATYRRLRKNYRYRVRLPVVMPITRFSYWATIQYPGFQSHYLRPRKHAAVHRPPRIRAIFDPNVSGGLRPPQISWSPLRARPMRVLSSASLLGKGASTPTRRTPVCCARAASGNVCCGATANAR